MIHTQGDNCGTVVGENLTLYGNLALWAVNGLSIVCWDIIQTNNKHFGSLCSLMCLIVYLDHCFLLIVKAKFHCMFVCLFDVTTQTSQTDKF